MMLALVHETPGSRPTSERLLQRLRDLGEEFAVFGDSPAWQGPAGVRYRPLLEGGRRLEPDEIRRQGGALFCDRRYGRVFVYHNGAESYYAARGFRATLRVQGAR